MVSWSASVCHWENGVCVGHLFTFRGMQCAVVRGRVPLQKQEMQGLCRDPPRCGCATRGMYKKHQMQGLSRLGVCVRVLLLDSF